jgi:CheY-like chemotaxis protein
MQASSAFSGKKILVVEDEFIIQILMVEMLQDLGSQAVVSAATIEEAIASISNENFDAALLDMNLNGRSSEMVADALAKSGVPFAYSTGNSTGDDRDGFRNRPVLHKPFTDEQCKRVVLGLLFDNAIQP